MERAKAGLHRYKAGWIILGGVIFALLCWHAINFTWDDPFISFRYAENLASGKGLVFNEGQRVEGYSNLLWVLIFAFLSAIGLSGWDFGLLVSAKILGVVIAIITLWLVGKAFLRLYPVDRKSSIAENDPTPGYFALIPLILMLTTIYYAAWTVSALETIFFALLVLIANYIVLGDILSGIASADASKTALNPMRPILAGFVFFLVAITRADGFIIFASAFISLLLHAGLKKIRWKYLIHLTWAFLLPSIIVLGWRISYYGDIFPNTFYNKAGLSLEHIRWGLIDVRQAIFDIDLHGDIYALFGTPIPFILMFVPFFFRKTWTNPRVMLIGFQAGAYLIYIVYKGLDWMGMFRFFIHILPLLALLSALGFAMLYDRWVKPAAKSPGYARRITTFFLVFIILGSLFGAKKHFVSRIDHFMSGFVKWPPPLMLEDHRDMGFWLRDQLQPGDLVAIGDAGAIPYFSDATILDMMGLMDRHIARVEAGQYFEKFDAEYIFSYEPDWLLLMGYLENNGGEFVNLSFLVPYGREIFRHPEFSAHYRLAHQEGALLIYRRIADAEPDPPDWQADYDPLDRIEYKMLGE